MDHCCECGCKLPSKYGFGSSNRVCIECGRALLEEMMPKKKKGSLQLKLKKGSSS